ncbi:MAG: hypothetical protein R2860_14305 [Desulfobacterales bacterium]
MRKKQAKHQNQSSTPAKKESSVTMRMSKEIINMDKMKKKKLESKESYKIGSAEDFLGLQQRRSGIYRTQNILSQALAKQRKQKKLTRSNWQKYLTQASQGWQKWKKETQPFRWTF